MMKATMNLPAGYSQAWELNLKTNKRLNWILQFVATGWFLLLAAGLTPIYQRLRPDYQVSIQIDDIPGLWLGLLGLVIDSVIVMTLHELVHGFFFWRFSGARPRFGVSWGYAYAGAPDWYFTRNPYLVIALAPLVVLTFVNTFLFVFAPANWLGWLYAAIILNAGGAIGDMLVAGRLLAAPPNTLVRDIGDAVSAYTLEETK